MTLIDFLLAQIAEDEERARYCIDRQDSGVWRQHVGDDIIRDERSGQEIVHYDGLRYLSDAHHVIRHAPARVLRECDAKRKIVQTMQTAADQAWQDGSAQPVIEFVVARTLKALAAVYADHPDYREEWKP